MIITAKTIKAGSAANSSGRVYPAHVLRRAAKEYNRDAKYVGYFLQSKDDIVHFAEALRSEDQVYREAFVSHILLDLKFENQFLVATIQTLGNPLGKMLESAARADKIAFRPSGNGSVNEEGEVYAFKLSAINAYNPDIL